MNQETNVHIIDHAGFKRLPTGATNFEAALRDCLLIDKTMLIADVLDSGNTATLFCRPRRFGKSLNMSMLKAFLEISPHETSRAALFEGTEIWVAKQGYYQQFQGKYPVIFMSLSSAKKDTWQDAYAEIYQVISDEFLRHAYLSQSEELEPEEQAFVTRIKNGSASKTEFDRSLYKLCLLLYKV